MSFKKRNPPKLSEEATAKFRKRVKERSDQMEIIIDKNNPVKVIDRDGFVLLDYKPITHIDGMTIDQIDDYLKDSVTY